MTVNGWISASGSISTSGSIQVVCGSTIVTPGEHVLLVDAVSQCGGRGSELGARVHAFGLDRIGCDVCGDMLAILDQSADRIGEVQLALLVRAVELIERGPDACGREDVDRGVDLVDCELFRRRIAGLDDRTHRAVAVSDHPAVLARVPRAERQDRGRGALSAVCLEEVAEQDRIDHRRVAAEDEQVPGDAVECFARRRERVAGSARLVLHRGLDPVELTDALRRGDDDERIRVDGTRRLEHPVDHSPAQDPVEVLRRVGLHPRAETAGEHDSCCVLVHGVGRIRGVVFAALRAARHFRLRRKCWGARIRTWDHGTKTRCLTTWLRPNVAVEV